MKPSNVAFISALIYTSLALATSGAFLAITWAGHYDWVTRLGGAGWVFLLTLIIAMPTVMPLVKKWRR